LPLAESTGLIIALDRFVMKTAIKQFSEWYQQGFNPGKISLNLTVKQMQQVDFIDFLKDTLAETKLEAKFVELELVESQIMSNPEEAIKLLNQLNEIGIKIAIDDFGTGYSSLSYLKKLPIDKLKIDQSFIRELPEDEEDAAISKAVIALANSLNMKIIAEGVETEKQKEFLVENGCVNIQGYLYSKPISSTEVSEILKDKETFFKKSL
jgi:EAL domain-containing protein (putative c-di-GMP-specific phosphodiesterase class I)